MNRGNQSVLNLGRGSHCVLSKRRKMPEIRTSVVKETCENLGPDSSPDDSGTVEEMPEYLILSRQTNVNLMPFIGQRFVSQDAAYEYYYSFAKQCGFSIRRHRTRGKDGVGRGVTRRDFTCHRSGYPRLKLSEGGKLQRNRKSTRCGCMAYMRVAKRADFDVPEWRVTGFSNVHNHELLKSNEVQPIPAYCTISADDKSRICMFAKAGMSVRQMVRLLELEKGVKIGCLPFTEIDMRNLLQSFGNVDQGNDPVDLLKMCKEKKDCDPNFKYDFKINANNRLEHIAWSYASSTKSYEVFGDAVVFDTTCRLDAYDMLLGVWIGVDNHGMNCFFGCVLLQDENMQSFSWALKTFLSFMNGKAPGTILTDQNIWLKEAIAVEMPRTKHAFCIWHIISRSSNWFYALLGSRFDSWKAEFHRLYNLHSVEEFEARWKEMIDTYELHGNKHTGSLYALRTFWALPFLRSHFFAGLTSAFKSESINAYIQRILSAQAVLENFVVQVAIVLDGKDQKMQQKVQKVTLKTGSPIESHAATILTPFAFCKLQEELLLAPQYASLMVDESYFIVRHHSKVEGRFKVLWSPHDEFISCSCHHFEFSGILCRHVIRVLSSNNCFYIPDQYLPMRWRHEVSSLRKPMQASLVDQTSKVQLFQSMVSTLITESIETEERLDVACDQITMVLARIKGCPGPLAGANDIDYSSPSDSMILLEVEDSDGIAQSYNENPHGSFNFTKFSDRKSRDGLHFYQKRRRSVPCGPFVDDANDCSMMKDVDLNGNGLGFL